MFSILSDAKRLVTHLEKATTDNIVFRLHYKITVLLHCVFLCLLGSKQYFGDPILCRSTGEDRMMDVYCWIHGTWTIKELFERKFRDQVAYPGVGRYEQDFERVTHSYYQWIPVALFLSATGFYIPRFCWKTYESGKMYFLVEGMTKPVSQDEQQCARITRLIGALNHTGNKRYVSHFTVCEVLNLVNLVVQWWTFDTFLEGQFLNYGSLYLDYYFERGEMAGLKAFNPMDKCFPKIAKCDFKLFAGEGGIQIKDAICTLPLNVINDRVFLVLWFWFLILTIITVLALVYRIACLFMVKARSLVLSRQCSKDLREKVDHICREICYPGWFLVCQISKNVDSMTFDAFVDCLALEIDLAAKGRSCYSPQNKVLPNISGKFSSPSFSSSNKGLRESSTETLPMKEMKTAALPTTTTTLAPPPPIMENSPLKSTYNLDGNPLINLS